MTPVGLPGRSFLDREYGRIVVGIDGSEWSRIALQWAAREAQHRGARLDVVMAWHYELAGEPLMASLADEYRLKVEEQAQQTVREVLGEDRAGLPGGTRVVDGHAAQVLVDAADAADLLVVGNRGRSGFRSMFLGSVSQYAVTHASCPVVVVPHPEHARREPLARR